MVMAITTTMTEARSTLPLLVWLSPAFPVGAFAYSHGLEWAVESHSIKDVATLADWLADLVENGAVRADCVLLAQAWRAADLAAILAVNALALALAPSTERRLETATQGTAFLHAVCDAWPSPALARLADSLGTGDIAYPVAIGAVASTHGLPLRATLEAFALAAVGNLVSAALRLGPIGQSEAQRIIARLQPALVALAAWAEAAGPDDLGTCAFRSDIASMRHETQYSRLFRS